MSLASPTHFTKRNRQLSTALDISPIEQSPPMGTSRPIRDIVHFQVYSQRFAPPPLSPACNKKGYANTCGISACGVIPYETRSCPVVPHHLLLWKLYVCRRRHVVVQCLPQRQSTREVWFRTGPGMAGPRSPVVGARPQRLFVLRLCRWPHLHQSPHRAGVHSRSLYQRQRLHEDRLLRANARRRG